MRKEIFSFFLLLSIISCKKEDTAKQPVMEDVPSVSSGSLGTTESIILDENRIWGINGHPIFQAAYNGNIDLQLELLKETGWIFTG
jgi:hypothetical protein